MLKRGKSFPGPSGNYLEVLATRYKTAITALNELSKDTALAKHRRTFEEIGKALSRLIENDYKWSIKCKKLEDDLSENEIKVKAALQLSDEDKHVIDTLKEELQNSWNLLDELKKTDEGEGGPTSVLCSVCNAVVRVGAENSKEDREAVAKLEDEKYSLIEEVERIKLQVFELEEELANRGRSLEEMTSSLNSKQEEVEGLVKANEKPDESKARSLHNDRVIGNSSGKTQLKDSASEEAPSTKMLSSLKRELQNASKREQLAAEKVKQLVKKNGALSRQLQKAQSYANLLKVQLGSQTKMLDLLSSQYCKLEEKDQKQARIINELETVRNKLIHMTGHLEGEVLEMRKRFAMVSQITEASAGY